MYAGGWRPGRYTECGCYDAMVRRFVPLCEKIEAANLSEKIFHSELKKWWDDFKNSEEYEVYQWLVANGHDIRDVLKNAERKREMKKEARENARQEAIRQKKQATLQKLNLTEEELRNLLA